MARAHRHYLPGQIWHLTHRCHERQFPFQFPRDRQAWRGWLYEARTRLGLCVLDYMVTLLLTIEKGPIVIIEKGPTHGNSTGSGRDIGQFQHCQDDDAIIVAVLDDLTPSKFDSLCSGNVHLSKVPI